MWLRVQHLTLPLLWLVHCYVHQQEGIVLWGGVPDRACSAALKEYSWQCYFSRIAVKYLKTRIFIHTEQFDGFQVPWDVGSNPPWNSEQVLLIPTPPALWLLVKGG